VILGHGNTELGEALRIYAEEQVVRVYHCRNEVAMAPRPPPFDGFTERRPPS
jgi:TPP-dependent trihydroxycyclohexane-1,2-dione (THcHDO) dehydratase